MYAALNISQLQSARGWRRRWIGRGYKEKKDSCREGWTEKDGQWDDGRTEWPTLLPMQAKYKRPLTVKHASRAQSFYPALLQRQTVKTRQKIDCLDLEPSSYKYLISDQQPFIALGLCLIRLLNLLQSLHYRLWTADATSDSYVWIHTLLAKLSNMCTEWSDQSNYENGKSWKCG